MAADPRRVIGSHVEAKACHVTSEAECARRYGAQKKTKRLVGIVTRVENVQNPTTLRTSTFIVACYDLGGETQKVARLNIRSIKAVSQQAPATTTTANGTQEGAQVGETTTTTTTVTTEDGGEVGTGDNNDTQTQEDSEAVTTTEVAEQPAPQPPAAPTTTENNGPTPTATPHDHEWWTDDAALRYPIKGIFHRRHWMIKTTSGDHIGKNGDRGQLHSRLAYFLMMFPPRQLSLTLQLTNTELGKNSHAYTNEKELLKFFGVLLLVTRFEFGNRASLWSTTASNKYIPAASFGKTGMARNHFDQLWSCIRWSHQPVNRPSDMTSEQYRWRLIDDFVDNFNDHRMNFFQPSHMLCVDESISRWYGQGGHWINHGLPMYVAIDRKPENGCEIQNAACGESGVMLRLKLVKTAEEEQTNTVEDEEGMTHGTKVLKYLVSPWARSDHVVCADSYFASVNATEEMARMGLRFIGVVKNATKKFPMSYLTNLELVQRGDYRGLVSKGTDSHPDMMAFVWMDRERRYFIANASSLEEGHPYTRKRWRQIDDAPDADPDQVTLLIPQPKCCEIYYSTCAAIDQHNRSRQDVLKLETKLETKRWDFRVNLTILGMIFVDTWKVFSQCTGSEEKQAEFYCNLAEELIDNSLSSRGSRERDDSDDSVDEDSPLFSRTTGRYRAGICAHLTPTKRKRTKKDGTVTNYRLQGKCMVCGIKTTYMCSECMDLEEWDRAPWLCHTDKRPHCFSTHFEQCHHNI